MAERDPKPPSRKAVSVAAKVLEAHLRFERTMLDEFGEGGSDWLVEKRADVRRIEKVLRHLRALNGEPA